MRRPVLDYAKLPEGLTTNEMTKRQAALAKLAWLCDNYEHSSAAQAEVIGKEVIDLLAESESPGIPIAWVASRAGSMTVLHLSARDGWEVHAVLYEKDPGQGHARVLETDRCSDCGYRWERGKDGSHSCVDRLIAEVRWYRELLISSEALRRGGNDERG